MSDHGIFAFIALALAAAVLVPWGVVRIADHRNVHGVALVLAGAVAFVGAVAVLNREREAYVRMQSEQCAAAGGVVVNMGGSLNCAGPDGKWIDVR